MKKDKSAFVLAVSILQQINICPNRWLDMEATAQKVTIDA